MKKMIVLAGLVVVPSFAQASCDVPKLARDAVRAIALVSNRAMITDMVGGCTDSCQVWANYRYHGYSDHYEIKSDVKSCRVLELKLVEANVPVKEAD